MIFNQHSDIRDKHAFLSPSNYHWLGYDEQKLEARFFTVMAARRGSDLHDLAHEAIRLNVKLADTNQSLATYVNDAIGYKMVCEQPLYYSTNCFGTADTICFRNEMLRIHDLKTGVTKTSPRQLEVYAALFCLEYGVSPLDIEMELRIYQRDDVLIFDTPPEAILEIMDKIVEFDRQIDSIKEAHW
jgi:hypothetical protein